MPEAGAIHPISGGAALTPHQSPVMDNPEQKTRQHQAYYDFGIDAGAAIVGTVKIGHFSAKPPKVENLIDLHQHMAIGDQIPQRPGDKKVPVARALSYPASQLLIHRHAK